MPLQCCCLPRQLPAHMARKALSGSFNGGAVSKHWDATWDWYLHACTRRFSRSQRLLGLQR